MCSVGLLVNKRLCEHHVAEETRPRYLIDGQRDSFSDGLHWLRMQFSASVKSDFASTFRVGR